MQNIGYRSTVSGVWKRSLEGGLMGITE